MTNKTRRGFLGVVAAAGGSAIAMAGPAQATPKHVTDCGPTPPPVTMGPDDPRYLELTTRGYNSRFFAQPETVRLVHTTNQIVQVVNEAVRAGKKIAVRSGGHCFESLVDDPSTTVIIDVSEMNDVYYDPHHRAFSIEAGATLGKAYRSLYLGWGVTIPAGGCPSVGAGGHIAGGGYGPLSRAHGLVVDHLYGVEVVTVDRQGQARVVLATRERNRDLWWAHTGGGGGTFGIVTRYLMRSPGASGNNPSALLPKPPALLFAASVSWQWADLDQAAFSRIADNYAQWLIDHEADAAYASMDSSLTMIHRSGGAIELFAGMDGTVPGADGLLWTFIQAVNEGVGVEPGFNLFGASPWMAAVLSNNSSGSLRFKSKAAYMRKKWTPEQLGRVYTYLTEGEDHYGAAVYLLSYGGKINTVDPAATAIPHRDSPFIAFYDVGWWDPAEDDRWLTSVRELYRDIHASTGGVPVPGEAYDGAYINYPDTDLADPAWNTSGVPWHTLYFKGNYAALQQAKARWDPRNVFNHALSVRPPGASDALPAQARPGANRTAAPAPAAKKTYPRAFPPRHVISSRTLGLQD